jgi:hypothetical protein
MTPRRQGGCDAGVHFTYSEELTTTLIKGSRASCFAPPAEGAETKGALECEVELNLFENIDLNPARKSILSDNYNLFTSGQPFKYFYHVTIGFTGLNHNLPGSIPIKNEYF